VAKKVAGRVTRVSGVMDDDDNDVSAAAARRRPHHPYTALQALAITEAEGCFDLE
jgi:hypothetical protein